MKIVFVSMDCVRTDHFDPAGLDTGERELFHFRNCITAASHTSTSHTTMLTGTYPFHHGVRWLVRYNIKDRMVQEILGEKGYRTGAFIGGFPLTQGDMDRGFDVFEHGPLVEDRNEGRSHFVPANILVQKAANFLNESEGDSFVFIHMFDAHLTLRSEFDVNTPPPEKDEHGIFIDIERHLGRRKRRYVEEVTFIKDQLRRLLELSDIDLMVVTADHGEKMQGEKGYPWVSNHLGDHVGSHFHEVELFDVQLKVPLVFIGKGIKEGYSDRIVRTVDITPTILEMADIKDEKAEFQGSSMKCPITGEGSVDIVDAYSETYFAQMNASNKHAADMNDRFNWGWKGIDNLVSLRTNDYKLICIANGRPEPYMLFDLRDDPNEERNIIDDEERSDIRNDLFSRIMEMIRNDVQYDIGTRSEESRKLSSTISKIRSKKEF